MLPNHPEARRFLELRLFSNLSSFRELEQRLDTLCDEEDKKAAFALFAEGVLATRSFPQAIEVLPREMLTPEIRRRYSLPERLLEAHGYLRANSGDTHPYHVIYCPGRAQLTAGDLAGFMQLKEQSEQPLLFSNSCNLHRGLQKQAGFHRLLAPDLDRLSTGEFSTFNRWLRGGGIAPARLAPSPGQIEGLNRVRAISESRAVLVPPLGSDYLQTMLNLLEGLGNQRTGLVVLPTHVHLRNLVHHWQKHSSWSSLIPLLVTTDFAKLKPADLDYPITNSCDGLRRFFSIRSKASAKVVLATEEVLPLIQRASIGFAGIDLAFITEANRLATTQGDFLRNTLLELDLPLQKQFFITVTPSRMDGLKPNKDGDLKPFYQLDEPELCGPQVVLGNMSEAIKKKSVRPWQFLLPILNPGENPLVALATCIQAKPDIHHINCRFSSGADAKRFVQDFSEQRPDSLVEFSAYCVEALKVGAEIDQQLAGYQQSSHGLLALAPGAVMGFNQQLADLLFFVRGGKREESDIFQPILTPRTGEKTGYIAVPIFAQAAEFMPESAVETQPTITDAELQNALMQSDDLWASLQLFREQDDKFAEELRTIRINFGRTGLLEPAALRQWLQVLPVGQNELQERVLKLCALRLSTMWDERFGQLLAFRDKHNHSNVPQRWPNNPELSLWAEQQRSSRRKGGLPTHREQELDDLGFVWEPKIAAWEEMFKELSLYKLQHKHCKVPKVWPQNPELADWVSRQRRERQSGRLEPEWASRLSALGFVWDLEADAWESGFKSLEQFRKIHGHSQIPNPNPQNRQLGDWAEAQRRQQRIGKLALERADRLDALGFIWDLEEAAWEERFNLLLRFIQVHGHGKVANKDKVMPKLADWAANQRKAKERGNLDPTRQERLEQAGFVWDLEQTCWDEMFVALKEYKLLNGRCNLPDKGLVKGSQLEKLSSWSQEQRALRRRNRLHPTRINRLNSLGFAWDLNVAFWEEMFAEFKQFKLTHCHGKLPDRYKKNPELGAWAKNMRRDYTAKKLDQDRQARLQEAGFVWDLEAAAWDENFAKLQDFYTKEGHFSLAPNMRSEPELPSWVKKQRAAKLKGVLKKSREERLAGIGFIWDIREAAWEEMFTALAKFTKSRNHCIVPAKWAENPRLAQWVNNLRRDYKKDLIPRDKFERLSALGFLWDAKAVFWEEMFVALTEYRDQFGDCLVPESYEPNSELGWWVATQRKAKISGQLDAERIQRLDALEFIWDIEDANWLDMYRQLFKFRQKNGNCLVPKAVPATMQLAAWCDQQRKNLQNRQMTPDKINRLTELGFIWDAKQVVVEEMLNILRKFKAEHGHCDVPIKDSKYSQLGLWIQFQRQSFKKGNLDPLRKEKLEEVGIIFDS